MEEHLPLNLQISINYGFKRNLAFGICELPPGKYVKNHRQPRHMCHHGNYRGPVARRGRDRLTLQSALLIWSKGGK